MRANVSTFGQDFQIYSTEGDFSGQQVSASVGNRHGAFSWWVNANRLDSDAPAIVFPNKLVSTGTPGTAGTPVTGVVEDFNPQLAVADHRRHERHEHCAIPCGNQNGLRIFAGPAPVLHAGVWENDAARSAETYLRDSAGNPFWVGVMNYGGSSYTVAPTDIAPTRGDLRHLMQGLSP